MAKEMTKSELAAHLSKKFGITKKRATEILDEVANLAITETRKTGAFTLPGIGKLVKTTRKARKGRNPATGAAIKIPSKYTIIFRVSNAAIGGIVSQKPRDPEEDANDEERLGK